MAQKKINKMNAETLTFLRQIFRVPKRTKTKWCVVETSGKNGLEYALGVQFADSRQYIDVAQRRIKTACNVCGVQTRLYPAKRISYDEGYRFEAIEKPDVFVNVSKTYIADIYYATVFEKSLMEQTLF
jgi:hypothetical protein